MPIFEFCEKYKSCNILFLLPLYESIIDTQLLAKIREHSGKFWLSRCEAKKAKVGRAVEDSVHIQSGLWGR